MKQRLIFFYLILILSFLALVTRLFLLQIIKGKDFLKISEENRIRVEKIEAVRGIIYDRKERVLTRNIPIYKLKTQNSKLKTIIINKDEALKRELGGEKVEMGLAREYPDGEVLSSVLGYVDAEMVGRMGIEAVYNERLKGKEGVRLVESDASGKVKHEISKKEPVSGENLKLFLDLDLQKKAAELLKGQKGAIVVAQPKGGQILALVSSPTFDPNFFSQNKGEGTERILDDPEQPLFNRAISGLYPPGSVFKIVTATAGLEEGKINSSTKIEDTGEIKVGIYRYGNWYFNQYGRKEGFLDIVGGLRRSNDIFFYKTGELVGAKKLVEWAKKFGFGKTTGIDLVGESGGEILDPEEKEKKTGELWFLGNTYHLSIGQGDLSVTPLQVNMMTNVIANGGKLCQPSVLDKTAEAKKKIGKNKEENCQDLGIKKETIDLITKGMKEACETGGTAWPFFDFKPQVACKTGTAEFNVPKKLTHAWFTVFVLPDEALVKSGIEPISVTVLVEGGGEGSSVAAPMAKEILKEWFTK